MQSVGQRRQWPLIVGVLVVAQVIAFLGMTYQVALPDRKWVVGLYLLMPGLWGVATLVRLPRQSAEEKARYLNSAAKYFIAITFGGLLAWFTAHTPIT